MYFDYEKQQKGYTQFQDDTSKRKSLIGKQVCYLVKRDYDPVRGYMFPKYGTITKILRNRAIIGNNDDEFNFHDILELAVKITDILN